MHPAATAEQRYGSLQPPRLDDPLQESPRALALRVLEDPLGRACLVHHAALEEAHLRGDVAREAHLVGGHQDGHAVAGEVTTDTHEMKRGREWSAPLE